MPYVRISVNGRSAVQGKIKGRIETFQQKVSDAVQGAGIDTEALAKQACPVDTGRLRASIKYTKMSLFKCTIGTNVKYARPVEFGHRTRNGKTVAPRPYLIPAHIKTKQALIAELKALVI